MNLLIEVESTITCNLGPIGRIPLGEGREYQVAGELIAVVRERQGRLYAVQAQCPHRAGPLADGIIGGGKVICPLHAFKFDLVTGQALGHELGHECASLKTYSVELNDRDEILLTL
jgi:nitrite reductase (NADH) small subunit